MIPDTHYNPNHINAPTAEKSSARLLFAVAAQMKCSIEQFDITNAYVHEKFAFIKKMYVREHARTNGSFKHGKNIGLLFKNLWGKKSAG